MNSINTDKLTEEIKLTEELRWLLYAKKTWASAEIDSCRLPLLRETVLSVQEYLIGATTEDSKQEPSSPKAKEIALDAAIEHFKGLTLIGQGSSGGVLAMAESVYQWLITDSIKQDNNG